MFILSLLVFVWIIAIMSFSVLRQKALSSGNELGELKKVKRIVYGALIALTIVFTILSSVYSTTEQETAFTVMLGETQMVDGAGIHIKVPFLSKVYKYDATTQGMAIGYNIDTDESEEADSLMITSDFNFVNIDFYIEYRISNPINYEYSSDDPVGILENIAQSAIRNTVGQYDVDSVITTGKSEIEIDVYDDISEELENHQIGITVVNVTIQDSEPPTTEVASAFKDVENAKQGATTAENEALEYQNTKIPAAEAEAEEIKNSATAAKTERINSATEEVATFNALFAEYQLNPDIVKTRLYYEALEDVLPNMEIIIGSDSKVIYVKDESVSTSQSN